MENEEYNDTYYWGDHRQYVKMLGWAAGVCKSFGVKVSNGGLHDPYLAFDYYLELKKTNADSAKIFMNKYFTTTMKNAAASSAAPFWSYYKGSDSLYQAYKTLGLDYLNFHMKEEGDGLIIDNDYVKALSDHVFRTTKKKFITNEVGLRVLDNPPSVNRIQHALRVSRVPETNYYSGTNNDNGVPLEVNGKLNTDGKLFRDYLIKNK